MTLITLATALLVAAVIIGIYLVFVGLYHRKRVPRLGGLHALLALSATAVLVLQIIDGPTDKINNVSAFFLVLALIGGGMVFALREEGRPPSMPVVTIHAIMGTVGLVLLLFNATS